MEVLQRFILAHEIVTDTHAVAAGFTTRLWPITEKDPTIQSSVANRKLQVLARLKA